ncbi:retrotransposable element ORF2 protein [Plecturocebus cupreus]
MMVEAFAKEEGNAKTYVTDEVTPLEKVHSLFFPIDTPAWVSCDHQEAPVRPSLQYNQVPTAFQAPLGSPLQPQAAVSYIPVTRASAGLKRASGPSLVAWVLQAASFGFSLGLNCGFRLGAVAHTCNPSTMECQGTWMNLETIILSKLTQEQKTKHRMLSLIGKC